jgi:hypothetical protein
VSGLVAIGLGVWLFFVAPQAMRAHDENAGLRNTFKYEASAAIFVKNIPITRIPVYVEDTPLSNNIVSLLVAYPKWIRCLCALGNPFFVRP